MGKTFRRRDSRGAMRGGRGSRRRNDYGREGVLTKAESKKTPVGIGFAHKFHRSSDEMVDQLILGNLKEADQDKPPYMVPKPRHVTSIARIAIDSYALKFLELGSDITEVAQDLQETFRKMDEPTHKPLECEIGEIIEIGGHNVVAEVHNARVNKIRNAMKTLFQRAGVAIPEMYATHFTVGQADSFRAQRRISDAAKEILVGQTVTVEDVSSYTNSYTELQRPEFIPVE